MGTIPETKSMIKDLILVQAWAEFCLEAKSDILQSLTWLASGSKLNYNLTDVVTEVIIYSQANPPSPRVYTAASKALIAINPAFTRLLMSYREYKCWYDNDGKDYGVEKKRSFLENEYKDLEAFYLGTERTIVLPQRLPPLDKPSQDIPGVICDDCDQKSTCQLYREFLSKA